VAATAAEAYLLGPVNIEKNIAGTTRPFKRVEEIPEVYSV